MNTSLKLTPKILFPLFLLITSAVFAQTEKTTIPKTYQFSPENRTKVFYLANINGSVVVRGHNSNEVKLTAERTVRVNSKEELERAKSVKIASMRRGDSIIVYINGPCNKFQFRTGKYQGNQGWCYDWDECEDKDFHYQFDFDVTIPADANLVVSTINKGDIQVDKISGVIIANNINGGITLNDISNQAKARTINGDVNLQYNENPQQPSRFYTLNGNINAYYPKDLSIDLTFKSFNGELFTNIRELEQLPVMVKKYSGDKGTSYKIGDRSNIKIRRGGVQLDFETFNGNVYIKEK